MSRNRPRKNLSIRLQPYADSPLAEVTDHLNILDKEESNRKVGDILTMCLLPYARLHAGASEEELRITCLEACDAMDKHASTMRQALKVPQLQFSHPNLVPVAALSGQANHLAASSTEASGGQENNVALRPTIQDKGPIEEVDKLFG